MCVTGSVVAHASSPHAFEGEIIVSDGNNPNGLELVGLLNGVFIDSVDIVETHYHIIIEDVTHGGGVVTFMIQDEESYESFNFTPFAKTDTDLTFTTVTPLPEPSDEDGGGSSGGGGGSSGAYYTTTDSSTDTSEHASETPYTTQPDDAPEEQKTDVEEIESFVGEHEKKSFFSFITGAFLHEDGTGLSPTGIFLVVFALFCIIIAVIYYIHR